MKLSALTISVTHRLLAMEFMAEFLMIYPFIAIMPEQRGHISAAGIGILLAAWYIAQVIAEVPTGIIADRISKKWVLVCAKSLRVFTFVTWLVWPSFGGYLAGFIIWGVGWAMSSGAFEAYLYESLPANSKHKYGNLYGKVNAIDMAAYVSAFIFSFLISTRYSILLLFSIAACVASVLIALSLPKSLRIVERSSKPRILRTAMTHIFRTSTLKDLLLAAIIIGTLGEVILNFRTLYYTQAGAPVRFAPLLMAAENLLAAVLFWHMTKFDKILTHRRPLVIAVASVIFITSFFTGPAGQILGLICLTRMTRLLQAHYQSAMQHLAQDATRATLLSIYSFVNKLATAGLLAVVGLLATTNSIVVPLRIVALGIVGSFLATQVFFFWRSRKSIPLESTPKLLVQEQSPQSQSEVPD